MDTRFMIIIALVVMFAGRAYAGSTKDNQIACTSKAAFQEGMKAAQARDEAWFRELQRKMKCLITKSGFKAQRLGCEGFLGMNGCRYRVWVPGAGSIILWMNRESIRD